VRKLPLNICEKHLVVKALAEDMEPYFSSISNFVSGMSREKGEIAA
jgi:hypothetical protein